MTAGSPALSGLTIGNLTLDPTFDAAVRSYTASTSNATNKITATAADADAEVAITLNGTAVENESALTWTAGENVVKVAVTKDGASTEYTVTVTKS